MENLKIFFLGKEQPFWNSLTERFQNEFPNREFDFYRYFPEGSLHFQTALIEIQDFNPDILFLDYSSHPKEMLTMARTIKRCLINQKAIIGFWDYSTSKHLIDESNTTGVYVNHIKSPEIGEVIFQALTLASDSPLDKKVYATAEYKTPLRSKLYHLMKIGYLTKDYMHLEHSVSLPSMGSPFNIQTDWCTIFDINKVELVRRIDQNFYYHYPFCSDVKYHFNLDFEEMPPFLKKDDEIAKWEKEQEEKLILDIKQHKNGIEKWILGHIKNNQPKRTRLLIIDPTLEVIRQAQKPLDEYPYSIRLYSQLYANGDQIHRVRPGMIAIQLENKNNHDELNQLFSCLNRESGINPFVIVFNTDNTTEELRALYNDEHLIAHQGPFDFDSVLKLCHSYEKNQGRKISHDQSISYAQSESRFYPSKSSPLSSAYLQVDISLLKLNEAFISFESPYPLTAYSVYSIRDPIDLAITVMGEEKGYAEYSYWGVIHCISEIERKKLRQFINKSIKSTTSSPKTDS